MQMPGSVRSKGLIAEKPPEEENGDFAGWWCLGKDRGLQLKENPSSFGFWRERAHHAVLLPGFL